MLDGFLRGGITPHGETKAISAHHSGSDTKKVGKSQQDGAREQRRSIWSELVGLECCKKGQQQWGPLSKALPSEQRGGGMLLPGCFPALFHFLAERSQYGPAVLLD